MFDINLGVAEIQAVALDEDGHIFGKYPLSNKWIRWLIIAISRKRFEEEWSCSWVVRHRTLNHWPLLDIIKPHNYVFLRSFELIVLLSEFVVLASTQETSQL